MLKIKANVKVIRRAKVACPDDGVHVAGKEGFIKGVHSLWFNDKLVPKGQTAFYWREPESERGIRVSYSFGWLKPISKRVVKREYNTMRECWKLGISPEPYGMEEVRLRLVYEHEKKNIMCDAFAIRVDHIHYPADAWRKYAEGHSYDWDASRHPEHNPDGFKAFVAAAKKKAGKLITTSWKLGDVVWCCKRERWYLCDCGT